MLKLLQAMKNRKGFTLMELIVVLIILAVLIAALTPVLIGWINDARETAIRAEGRTALLAVQTAFTEAKGTGEWLTATGTTPFVEITSATEPILLSNARYQYLITEAGMATNYGVFRIVGSTPGIAAVVLDGSNNVIGLHVINTNRNGADVDNVGTGLLLVGRRAP